MKIKLCVFVVSVLHVVRSEPAIDENAAAKERPPYINVILCPMQKEPWECFRQQSGRLIDLLDQSYKVKWSEFKDQASNEITARMQARGFSATNKIKEKTTSIFEKIEAGVVEIKEFAESTANDLLGREEESDYELDEDDDEETEPEAQDKKKGQQVVEVVLSGAGGGHGGGHGGGGHGGGGHGNKIKKKKKKKPQGAIANLEEHDDLEEIEWTAELLEGLGGGGHGGGGHGGNHGIKFPNKYGRSLGVNRGKKKKKRKAVMKLLLIGSVIKGKIELLLKLLSAHLQIKFFAIALVGLLINLARFWLDVKRGQTPQKVIYYEHAHHQHHYDEHDDWDHGGGGGYWRRTVPASGENPSENFDEDSHYSRINDDYQSSYLKEAPQRMAYQRQLPGIRSQ